MNTTAYEPVTSSQSYQQTGRTRAVARDIVLLSEPFGVRAEALRALRAHVMAQHVRGRRRALAVCATRAKTGCTFVAANLAVGLSQIGLNTLLVDGDLRAPSIQTLLPPPPNIGDLSRCLSSQDVAFGDCIAADVLPGLSIMYAGVSATPPPELLAGDRFKSLMDLCLREFDVTIVDTPPADRYSDGQRIAAVVGYALIVARRHKTLVKDVKTLATQLAQDHAHVIGTVLNEA
jgi:capsular exopolysaccharide synthesis family protein